MTGKSYLLMKGPFAVIHENVLHSLHQNCFTLITIKVIQNVNIMLKSMAIFYYSKYKKRYLHAYKNVYL